MPTYTLRVNGASRQVDVESDTRLLWVLRDVLGLTGKSTAEPGGVGEPGVPPIAAAVANALFTLTGVRAKRLPLRAKAFATVGTR